MKVLGLVVAGALGWALTGPVFADTLDSQFHGHAVSGVADLPGQYTPPESYTVRLILDAVPSGAGVGPWYPWDPFQQYTVVIETSVLTYTPGAFWFVSFDPNDSTVRIYADNTTAADFQNPVTFEDGTLLLSGASSDLGGFGSGTDLWNIFGTIALTGGAGLGNLECTDPIITINDFVDTLISVPANYDENYDAKWDCDGITTSVTESTFGRIKASYR